MLPTNPIGSCDLWSDIVSLPPIVPPETIVTTAIAKMAEAGASCVLIMASDFTEPTAANLLGILTERDLVRLYSQPLPLAQLPIQAVMTQPVLTQRRSALTEVTLVLKLFQQHQIRHLPLLDEDDRLVGLLTQDSVMAWAAGDLTASRHREQTLLERDAQSRAVLSAVPDLMFRVGSDEVYRGYVTSHIPADIVPQTVDPVGQCMADLLPPDLVQRQRYHLRQALQTGEVQIYEQQLQVDDRLQEEEVRVVPSGPDEVLFMIRDISDRKAAEAALQNREQFLRSIYEGVEQAIFTIAVLDKGEFCFIDFNPVAERLSGQPVSQLRGKPPGEKVRSNYEACVQAGTSITYEECLTFGEQPSWWLTTLNPIRDGAGRIYQIVGTSTAITRRKQLETKLELQNVILAKIAKADPLDHILDTLLQGMNHQFGNALCSVMICDGTGHLRSGPAPGLPEAYLQEIDGIPIGEGIGSCGTAVFRGEPVIVTDIATDPLWAIGRDLAAKHGLRACWSCPIFASDGRILGTFGVYYAAPRSPELQEQDSLVQAAYIAGIAIEREQAAQALVQLNQSLEQRVEERTAALQASERRYANLAAAVPVAIFRFDLSYQCIYVNDRWGEMTGRPTASAMGIGWMDTLHPDDRASTQAHLARWMQSDQARPFQSEARILRPDGTMIWYYCQMLPETDEQNQPIGYVGTLTDITAYKQAEAALSQSESLFRTAFNSTVVGMALTSLELKFLKVNAAFCQFLRYDEAELLQLTVPEVTHPKDSELSLELGRQVLQSTHQTPTIEKRYVTKAGPIVWGLLSVSVVRDSQGQPLHFVTHIQDITDRKRAEQENRRLKERLQFLLSSSPAIIFTCQAEGDYGVTFVSDNVYNTTGYTPAQFTTEPGFWAGHLHPEDAPLVFAGLSELFEQGHHIHEYRFQHRAGHYLWIRNELRLIRDQQGEPIEIVGYFVDISDRKRLEQEQARLINILEASTDYIMIVDATFQPIWKNAALKRLLGLDAQVDLTQSPAIDYHPDWVDALLHQDALPAAIAQGHWLGESIVLDADGKEIPVSQLILVHRSPQGAVEFFSTIMRDMRVQKEYEDQLARTNAELLRATRLKDEFLANMSHELRTPLNAILGLTEGMQEEVFGPLNDRQRQTLTTIERSGTHLLELINDILDVAKIESGQLELNYTTLAVASLCQSSLAFIKQQALKKRIQIEVNLPDHLPDLRVDERRIRQVLINLLNNAVKFTLEGGRITLQVSCLPHSGKTTDIGGFLRIAVIDTGIGIAPENLKKLFQPFIQIDSALNRQYPGTGLGLALVKRIVELHGGRVGLTSELGVGSCFTIDLPYPATTFLPFKATVSDASNATSVDPETAPEVPLILLVEDNEANISTISAYLEAKGYRLLVARDGQAAIDLTITHHPALILMDIQMPGMDGLEAMRHIRCHPDLLHIPIIALTALAMEGDRERCLDAGANDYLTKPVKLKALATMIQTLLTAKELAIE